MTKQGNICNDDVCRHDYKNAKKPPKIVHTTICRFLKEIPISEIKTLVREINVDIIEKIDGFELVRTSKSPLLEFSVIKKYEL